MNGSVTFCCCFIHTYFSLVVVDRFEKLVDGGQSVVHFGSDIIMCLRYFRYFNFRPDFVNVAVRR